MRPVIVLLVVCRIAAGQPADVTVDVTIDRAVELYRVRNPRLAVQRAAIDVTAADLVEARIYPNPTINASASSTVHGTATSGDTLEQGGLEVPLLIGKRGARERAAEHRIATTRADVATSEADGTLEVRRRFVALLAAQERVGAMTAALDEVRK